MDYIQNTPVTLQFENCNMTQCHSIPIVDDDVLEGNEMFYVTLEGTADLDLDKVLLDPTNGTIDIVDNEKCKCASLWACKHCFSINTCILIYSCTMLSFYVLESWYIDYQVPKCSLAITYSQMEQL